MAVDYRQRKKVEEKELFISIKILERERGIKYSKKIRILISFRLKLIKTALHTKWHKTEIFIDTSSIVLITVLILCDN